MIVNASISSSSRRGRTSVLGNIYDERMESDERISGREARTVVLDYSTSA
jgi:hypothetical protein